MSWATCHWNMTVTRTALWAHTHKRDRSAYWRELLPKWTNPRLLFLFFHFSYFLFIFREREIIMVGGVALLGTRVTTARIICIARLEKNVLGPRLFLIFLDVCFFRYFAPLKFPQASFVVNTNNTLANDRVSATRKHIIYNRSRFWRFWNYTSFN